MRYAAVCSPRYRVGRSARRSFNRRATATATRRSDRFSFSTRETWLTDLPTAAATAETPPCPSRSLISYLERGMLYGVQGKGCAIRSPRNWFSSSEMSRGSAEGVSRDTPQWADSQIVERINRARGGLLQRSGREVSWADLGRALHWLPSTTTAAKQGTRGFRIGEIAEMAALLDCSPGWLAFAEGQMWGGRSGQFEIQPGVTSATTGVDAAEATAREIAEAEAREREEAARRKRAVGEGPIRPASDGPGRSPGRAGPGKPRRGR